MPRRNLQTLLLGAVLVASGLVLGFLFLFPHDSTANGAPLSNLKLANIPFNGARAYDYLLQICRLGPRPSGSPGMAAQQKLLTEHFQALGGQVRRQEFRIRHPVDGSAVPMANLLVQWHPERKDRALLVAHYDTRPFPDQDRFNPRGVFIGANDGASGVALMMELAHDMPKLSGPVGVDFLLVDGEEFIFDDRRDAYFLGSEYFARDYAANPPAYRYRWGVVLDMIGDGDLQIYQEKNSVSWPETKPVVDAIWRVAARLGVKEFIPRARFEIRDDHLALRNIGKIPTCDVIDFDYPNERSLVTFWHTEADTPDKCSALSLAKVGWVMQEWLQTLK